MRSIVGERFGRLVVVDHGAGSAAQRITCSCVCDCGSRHSTQMSNLIRGYTKSCGCLKREKDIERILAAGARKRAQWKPRACASCGSAIDPRPYGARFCSSLCRGANRRRYKNFFDAVTVGDGCWEWGGKLDAYGYGRATRHDGGRDKAHRYAWELSHGEIPPDMCVCHHCDNPRCVRADHLFLGTQGDNGRDKVTKRRHSHGDTHAFAKLSSPLVLEIRKRAASGESIASLAREYGVRHRTMRCAVRGETWRYVS